MVHAKETNNVKLKYAQLLFHGKELKNQHEAMQKCHPCYQGTKFTNCKMQRPRDFVSHMVDGSDPERGSAEIPPCPLDGSNKLSPSQCCQHEDSVAHDDIEYGVIDPNRTRALKMHKNEVELQTLVAHGSAASGM